MAAPLALALAGASLGWVTQSQSKYGATPGNINAVYTGGKPNLAEGVDEMYAGLGYIWHMPALTDDNRGLGGGIAWAWDDDLCKPKELAGKATDYLEDQFMEDFFFYAFITCEDLRATMHRAFQTWSDVHPDINFVDVTEQCRRIHGEVKSNCSLVELWVTHRNDQGIIPPSSGGIYSSTDDDILDHPKSWPSDAGSQGYGELPTVARTTDEAVSSLSCQTVGALPLKSSDAPIYPFPPGIELKDLDFTTRGYPGELEAAKNCRKHWKSLAILSGLADTALARLGFAPIQKAPFNPLDEDETNAGVEATTSFGRRRSLQEVPALTAEDGIDATEAFAGAAGVAAASATQFGRFAPDLRSTNGIIPKDHEGNAYMAIETYGGVISFNAQKCWYLDTFFCGPLHKLKTNIGTQAAESLVLGVAFGCFSLALLVAVMLFIRVARHQHCCDGVGRKRTCMDKLRSSADEISSFGVLPSTILLLGLWVPISLQNTIVKPCWQCYDFEAAAVHEIGHILGLNHPDAIRPLEGYPTGSNVYSNVTAANDGMVAYDAPGQPLDACLQPWKYVVDGVYPEATDKNPDTGVRQSIMYSLTEHNPQVCLTPDDLEAINTIYPRCDGRGMTKTNGGDLVCYKTKLYIGAVRVLVYIFVPVLFLVFLQLLVLSCLKHHHDKKVDKLHATAKEAHKDKEKHKRKSIEMQQRATQIQEALEQQIATEDARVEEKAREMAAQQIQARLRGNMARRASQSQEGGGSIARAQREERL